MTIKIENINMSKYNFILYKRMDYGTKDEHVNGWKMDIEMHFG
jgi:hypothetical protein